MKHKCALTIGYSYILFGLLAERDGFEIHIVISQNSDRIIPRTCEIEEYIVKYNNKLVCWTDPLNPSGKMFEESEFREFFRICKTYGCILLLDKCQRDEIQIKNKKNYF